MAKVMSAGDSGSPQTRVTPARPLTDFLLADPPDDDAALLAEPERQAAEAQRRIRERAGNTKVPEDPETRRRCRPSGA